MGLFSKNNFDEAVIQIEGMSCGHCSAHIAGLLRDIDGIESAKVNHRNGLAKVKYSDKNAIDKAKTAIDEAGYTYVGVEWKQ
ncbi:heavy metal-associated domain protein [Eubacterium saphenum ATCC 49989]|nr:heavy metal-associated domain protein [Eubacterium saphenum ATCC 49989]